jgi:hypothetical protein
MLFGVRRFSLVSSIFAASLLACGDPSIEARDGGIMDAAGSADPPQKPTLDAPPSRQPWRIVTLHGRAPGARRVIVEGGGNPIASPVLPDNSFCVDVELDEPDTYQLTVLAQGSDGQLSEPTAAASVTFDVTAPGIPGLSTCTGADPAGCQSTVEICDNNRDDDCNNLVDARDPDCANCTDDAFEPNDDHNAPRIDPGRKDSLRICPANIDYYGVYAREGETITARAFFVHAQGNIDLELFGLDRQSIIARATSLDDDETLTHTATVTGEYDLRVFSADAAANDYALDLRIE